jgi:DNA-binding SARP family transcriptional activator
LLGYLALSPGHRDHKERLAAMLWSDRDPKSARRALPQCLRRAAEAFHNLPSSPVLQDTGSVFLDEGTTSVDLDVISEKIELGVIDSILVERPDWPDSLLRGTDAIGPLYRSWLEVTRHNWRTRIADALEASLDRFEPGDAVLRRAASALLLLERGHEIAVQKLIAHHAHHHNVAMAVKVFKEFSAYIAQQFQISPSRTTAGLIEDITEGNWKATGEAASVARDESRAPTLEVDRIDTSATAEENLHLAAGFRNELLANLARFREWIVQESSMDAAGEGGKRSDYRLSLSCLRTKGGLAMQLALLDNESQRVVWSETIDVAIETWFDALRLVIRQVAARLQIYLSSDRVSRLVGGGKAALKSYDAWLRAEHLLSLWDPGAEDEAGEILRRVVGEDPKFAPALASLASIYNVRHLIRPGSPADANQDRQALQLARKAVELDALDARNQLVVAWSSAMSGEFDKAAIHYELAVSLNPVAPKLLISAAQGLAFLGASARARQLMEEALQAAPFLLPYQWCYVCSTCWMIEDYEGALKAATRGELTTIDTYGWRAAALSMLGRSKEARKAFSDQVGAVIPLWAGEQEAKAAVVLDWFTSAFPIAREADRVRLREALLGGLPLRG